MKLISRFLLTLLHKSCMNQEWRPKGSNLRHSRKHLGWGSANSLRWRLYQRKLHMWSMMKPKIRHLLGVSVFLPLTLLLLYSVTQNTPAYNEASRFVQTDAATSRQIGRVIETKFNFWDGFAFTGSNANFSIEAIGEKGRCTVDVSLIHVNGKWHVESSAIR